MTDIDIESAAADDTHTIHHDDRACSSLESSIPKLGLGPTESRPSLEARTTSAASSSPPSAMSSTPTSTPSPPIFSLSNELLIEIFSNLCPNDIFACRAACRQLNELIVNSQLIQYIIRTALSGVYDPLDLGLSLPERLVALERWEVAWQEVDLRESKGRIDAPIPKSRSAVEFSFGRYFVVIREGYARQAGYSFLDMHATYSSQHTEVERWTTIKVDLPNVLVFAFASELDLAVAISCVSRSLALSLRFLTRSSLPLPPLFSCGILSLGCGCVA
jgi:hypothetical protein